MTKTVEQALAETIFYSDGQEYVVVHLPVRAITAAAGVLAEVGEPFSAIIVDKDEVSLVVPAKAWADFSNRLPGHVVAENLYRLITMDAELDMSLVGFMARISGALAAVNVPILPLAAYTRDHLLVPAQQFEVAMAALERLKSTT